MMDICDLHIHSTFSDGTDTPAELVKKAETAGLRAIALTDHNTVKGLREFMEAGQNSPVETIAGIEFTTEHPNIRHDIHLIALFLPQDSWEEVSEYVVRRNIRKEKSNRELVERLGAAGYPITYDEVTEGKKDVSVNRANIAGVLYRKGLFPSMQEMFDTILKEGNGFYEKAEGLPFIQTIEKIKEWGGVSVWAHPLLRGKQDYIEEVLKEARAAGLDGLETVYSTYDQGEHEYAVSLAQKYDLLQSGGSDYHGKNKPDISLGTGRGNLQIPYVFCEELKNF